MSQVCAGCGAPWPRTGDARQTALILRARVLENQIAYWRIEAERWLGVAPGGEHYLDAMSRAFKINEQLEVIVCNLCPHEFKVIGVAPRGSPIKVCVFCGAEDVSGG